MVGIIDVVYDHIPWAYDDSIEKKEQVQHNEWRTMSLSLVYLVLFSLCLYMCNRCYLNFTLFLWLARV